MPFINGRFYANPLFGEGVERARDAESDDEFSDEALRLGPDRSPEFADPLAKYGTVDDTAESEFQVDSTQHHARTKQHPAHKKTHAAKPESPEQNANRVYNETSGLRPTTRYGRGSAQDLHDARLYIAHALDNREAAGRVGIVAPKKLRPREADAIHTYPPAKQAYDDSRSAAQKAASSPDPTNGAKNYYLDYGQDPPPWAVGKPIAVFGPFVNASGGAGVHNPKKGDKVHIRVYHLKH
ncbi:MAG: hypothetical protein ACYDD2_11195 [Candidatus Acidiferrales bacterium]